MMRKRKKDEKERMKFWMMTKDSVKDMKKKADGEPEDEEENQIYVVSMQ